MKYQLFIALRYLRAKHKQAFTSVITVISMLGIAIGVMALVVALSLMTGMHDEIRNNLLGSRAHITIYDGSSERTIKNFEEIRSKLLAMDEVEGVSPLVRENGLVQSNYDKMPAFIHGIKPGESETVIDVFNNIERGDWTNMEQRLGPEGKSPRQGCIIGYEMARSLGVTIGDIVRIHMPSNITIMAGQVRYPFVHFRIAAIFNTNDWMADSSFVYIPLERMQKVLSLGEGYTMLQIKLKDMYAVDEVKAKMKELLGGYQFISTWKEDNAQFFEALQLEKLAMFLAIVLIITVAALNIISTLIMLVMEKNRDIGVLMSMGASSRGVMSAFMLQGVIIGLVGTVIGLILGISLSFILDYYELIKLPGEVYYISSVKFKVKFLDTLMVAGVSLLISLLATIYPAWKASRLRPAEALRYE